MSLMSLRAYARHRGVTLSAVQKALKAGRIRAARIEARGKSRRYLIETLAADRDWALNTDATHQPNPTLRDRGIVETAQRGLTLDAEPTSLFEEPARDGPTGAEALEAGTGIPGPSQNNRLAEQYYEARSEKEQLAAAAARLNLDERAGRLVRADAVRLEHFNQGARLQRQLLAIPARVTAAIVAVMAEADPQEIAHAQILSILDAEIRAAIRTICENERAHVNRNHNKTEGGQNGANVDIS